MRVTTIVGRPGSQRPMASCVRRPMISGWPRVTFLKRAQSSAISNGWRSPSPMTPLAPTMAMAVMRMGPIVAARHPSSRSGSTDH